MNEDVGIIAYGAYVPQNRLRRSAIVSANAWAIQTLAAQSVGERAFGGWDEDAVTMAVEAARDALGGLPRQSIKGVILASTTAPFADRLNAGIVSGALGIPTSVIAFDIGGSMRAGTSAMVAGAALAGSCDGPVIVTAAERLNAKPGSLQERQNADAAAAVILGRQNVIARILATHSLTIDFVDHFRVAGQAHDYHWEERWVRDEGYLKIVPAAVTAVLATARLAVSDIQYFLLPAPLKSVEQAVAKVLGIAAEAVPESLQQSLGFAGSAHPLIMLADVLEQARPGEHILLAGFGNGCDAILLQVTPKIDEVAPRRGFKGWLQASSTTDDYMRFLSYNNEVSMDWGPRAEFGNKYALTAEYRDSRDMLAFIGGRDVRTGNVQFPKTPMALGPGASGIATYEDVPFAELTAKVIAGTADWLTYHPSPPFHFGLVEFDNGARVPMEFVDILGPTVPIGSQVRMRFRVKEIDRFRHYRHYFWKAAPDMIAAPAPI